MHDLMKVGRAREGEGVGERDRGERETERGSWQAGRVQQQRRLGWVGGALLQPAVQSLRAAGSLAALPTLPRLCAPCSSLPSCIPTRAPPQQTKLVPRPAPPQCVEESDLIFAASGSEELLVHKEDIENMPAASEKVGGVRRFVDISVPRNIAPQLNELEGAIVYNVDDLKEVRCCFCVCGPPSYRCWAAAGPLPAGAGVCACRLQPALQADHSPPHPLGPSLPAPLPHHLPFVLRWWQPTRRSVRARPPRPRCCSRRSSWRLRRGATRWRRCPPSRRCAARCVAGFLLGRALARLPCLPLELTGAPAAVLHRSVLCRGLPCCWCLMPPVHAGALLMLLAVPPHPHLPQAESIRATELEKTLNKLGDGLTNKQKKVRGWLGA